MGLFSVQVLHEASGLMEKAADFYSGQVENALARRDRSDLLNPRSSGDIVRYVRGLMCDGFYCCHVLISF